jgi:toxin ParE1/3/4
LPKRTDGAGRKSGDRTLNLSSRSKRDLDEIWDYTESLWGAQQANAYITDIRRAMEKAAGNPGLGRACDEIHSGYFKLLVGSHMIFYRRSGTGIRILRVLHQRRDFPRHF